MLLLAMVPALVPLGGISGRHGGGVAAGVHARVGRDLLGGGRDSSGWGVVEACFME